MCAIGGCGSTPQRSRLVEADCGERAALDEEMACQLMGGAPNPRDECRRAAREEDDDNRRKQNHRRLEL